VKSTHDHFGRTSRPGNLDSRHICLKSWVVFQYLNEEHGITIALVTHEPDIAEYTKTSG